jgi:flagellar biosynthesis/type III secretory pathway chaperone
LKGGKDPVASLIEELMGTLEEENREYQRFLVIAREKTDAIVKRDLERLQNSVEEEQTIASRIATLDKRREECTKDIAIVINRPLDTLTVRNLIALMGRQPEVKERLEEIYRSLHSTIKQVRRVNDMNQGLLRESLELVEFDMNLLKSMKQAPLTADYDRFAYNKDIHLISRGSFNKSQ